MRPFNFLPLAACTAFMTFNSSLPAQAVPAIDLGTAGNFAVLAGTTVTNTGPTTIVGNVGVAPGTAITGFPPGSVASPGGLHANDSTAIQAESDLQTALNQGQALTPGTSLTGQDLGGLTLTPGVYDFTTSAQLTGNLNLNDLGNPNAEIVFQVGTSLTTATGSEVLLNGENGDNVFWVVGTSATLGTGTSFEGNILADTSITLDNGSTIGSGRALAENGAVTLDTNAISVPASEVPELSPSTVAAPLALFGFFGLLLADRRRKAIVG